MCELEENIIKCLSKILEIDMERVMSFDRSAKLEDIGFTSVRFIKFVVCIEERLKIEIRDSDLLLSNFYSIDAIIHTLKKYNMRPKNIKKCLIIDADNVLWYGISGEEVCRVDEQVIQFHELLVSLYEKGVLLAICSKNEMKNLDEMFETLNTPLKKEYFIYIHANRKDKVSNIISISKDLNISTDSIVFADDSDYELGFVSLNLPEVDVFKVDYSSFEFFENIINCFLQIGLPSNDMNRTSLYIQQKEREKYKNQCISIEEYNSSLETKLLIDKATVRNLDRLSELSYRTNQFNMSGRTYSIEKLESIIKDSNYFVYTLSASDKYGDMGIIGFSVICQDVIESFFLSCRAFDRNFELFFIDEIKKIMKIPLQGIYIHNQKNDRYKNFYKENGIAIIADAQYK